MELISSQVTYYFGDRSVGRNIRALLKYVSFLRAVIVLFAVLFHVIMLHAEGEEHFAGHFYGRTD